MYRGGGALEKPSGFMFYRSGSAQGSETADSYQPAIAVGGAGPDFVLFNDADLSAGLHQIVGAGRSNGPAADDENVTVSVHF